MYSLLYIVDQRNIIYVILYIYIYYIYIRSRYIFTYLTLAECTLSGPVASDTGGINSHHITVIVPDFVFNAVT